MIWSPRLHTRKPCVVGSSIEGYEIKLHLLYKKIHVSLQEFEVSSRHRATQRLQTRRDAARCITNQRYFSGTRCHAYHRLHAASRGVTMDLAASRCVARIPWPLKNQRVATQWADYLFSTHPIKAWIYVDNHPQKEFSSPDINMRSSRLKRGIGMPNEWE